MWQISQHIGSQRRSLAPDEFASRFLEVCEGHRSQGRALAFAFILYDIGHPQVRTALRRQPYWDALDQLSGRALTVFSFPVDPSLAASPVGELRKYFPGLRDQDLPCVLFFQVLNGEVVDSRAVALRSEATSADAAYNEMNEVLRRAVQSVAQVEDESAVNAREIFGLIRGEMDERALRLRALRVLPAIKHVATAAALAKTLLSLVLGR